MRADGGLDRTYESTDAFVDELSKYLKISTRCKASNIADCWPTKTITMSDGKEYDVSKAKTGKDIGIEANETDNVGMILVDGTALIMTYNTNADLISDGDTIRATFAELPIGFGKTKKFAYTSSVTNPIDFIMDTNGYRGPNSEQRAGSDKMLDVRPFKLAHFSAKPVLGVEVPGVGHVYQLPSITAENTCDGTNKWDTNMTTAAGGIAAQYCDQNRWAGAKAGCDALGMH